MYLRTDKNKTRHKNFTDYSVVDDPKYINTVIAMSSKKRFV